MIIIDRDYIRYFAVAKADEDRWGVGLTAAGFTTISPRTVYPPASHPSDHHLDWTRGRALDAMQIVLITKGRGIFETRTLGCRTVEAGTAFILLPKVWHRYRPDNAIGWSESWIEVRGPTVDRLIHSKVFSSANALLQVDHTIGLDIALKAVHAQARVAGPGFDPEMAASALYVLATLDKARRERPAKSRLLRTVRAAERHLADHYSETINVESLAQHLGIAYSHFRRVFKAQTGFSPWQYVTHLRLARARRMLASTDASLEEIARSVGFGSAFHFSTAFKRNNGLAPHHWRRQLATRRGN